MFDLKPPMPAASVGAGGVPDSLKQFMADDQLLAMLSGKQNPGSGGLFGLPSAIAPQPPKIPGITNK